MARCMYVTFYVIGYEHMCHAIFDVIKRRYLRIILIRDTFGLSNEITYVNHNMDEALLKHKTISQVCNLS